MRKNVSNVSKMGTYSSLFLTIDLVWRSIADALGSISSTWYEHEEIITKLNAFRRVSELKLIQDAHSTLLSQDLFSPLVKELGFEYSDGESVDISQLRTKIIEQAAGAGDET